MNWRGRGASATLVATVVAAMMAGGMMQAQSAAPAPAAPSTDAPATRIHGERQGGGEARLRPAGGIGPGAVPPRQEPRGARSARSGWRSFLRAALRGAQLAEADGPAHAPARHAGAVSRGESRVAALHLRQRWPEDLLAEGAPLRRRHAARGLVRQRLPLVARRRAAGVPGAPADRHAGVDGGRAHRQGGSGERRGRDGHARAARRRRQSERARARQPDAAVAARRLAADAARAGAIAGPSPPIRRSRPDRKCGGRATRRRRPRRSRSCCDRRTTMRCSSTTRRRSSRRSRLAARRRRSARRRCTRSSR